MTSTWTRALGAVAARWTDPDHPARAAAAADTLTAGNTFTEESIAFEVNVAADLLASGRLEAWLSRGAGAGSGCAVAVVSGGRTATEGLLELAAVGLLGMEGLGHAPAASPALARAFFEEVAAAAGELRVRFVERPQLFDAADAAVGTATAAEREAWDRDADAAGIAPSRRLWLPVGWGVAVLDGRESRAELSGLAEDMLLHEGGTPRSVRLLWAPEGLSPDPLLGVLAAFREQHPAHPATDGALAMPAAFLEAARRPVAVGPGFLLSKGSPEPQPGAHLRWAEYASLAEVAAWLQEHAARVAFVTARPDVAGRLALEGLPTLGFGDAHRPEPGRVPLPDVLATFLTGLL